MALRTLWIAWLGFGLFLIACELYIGVPYRLVGILLAAVVGLPIAVIIHEIGHGWAAVAVGLKGIRLERVGYTVAITTPHGTPSQNAYVAFGGPLLSAAVGALLGAVEAFWPSGVALAPALICGSGALSLFPFFGDGRQFWTWAWTSMPSRKAS